MSAASDQFRGAVQAGDLEGMLDALAPDAFLCSPVAGGLRFQGRDQLARLFAATIDAYEDVEVTHDLGNGASWLLALRARIGDQPFEETLLLRLGDEGKIAELTALIRPLPGVAAVALAVGGRLARRHGRMRALALAALTSPLLRMTRSADRVGPRLLGPLGGHGR